MTVDLKNLRPEHLETFLDWVRKQKEYFAELEAVLLASNGAMTPKEALSTDAADTDTEEVVYTILRKNGGWMQSADIRQEYKKLAGQDIERLALRTVLKAGEGDRFKRQGEARLTQWKAVS